MPATLPQVPVPWEGQPDYVAWNFALRRQLMALSSFALSTVVSGANVVFLLSHHSFNVLCHESCTSVGT